MTGIDASVMIFEDKDATVFVITPDASGHIEFRTNSPDVLRATGNSFFRAAHEAMQAAAILEGEPIPGTPFAGLRVGRSQVCTRCGGTDAECCHCAGTGVEPPKARALPLTTDARTWDEGGTVDPLGVKHLPIPAIARLAEHEARVREKYAEVAS